MTRFVAVGRLAAEHPVAAGRPAWIRRSLDRLGPLTRCTAHVPVAESPGNVLAIVTAEIASDELARDRPENLVVLEALARVLPEGALIEAWIVEGRLQWDYERDWPDGKVSPGSKRLSFVRRAPHLTRSQFADHWSRLHAPLVRKHHPGVWRYQQNVVVRALTPGAAEIDGVAELSFRSAEDLQHRLYDSREGKWIIAADVRRFIDAAAGWRALTEEYVLRS